MLLWNISGSVLENVWCGVHFARSDWYLRNCVNWSVASAERQTVHVTHPAPSRTGTANAQGTVRAPAPTICVLERQRRFGIYLDWHRNGAPRKQNSECQAKHHKDEQKLQTKHVLVCGITKSGPRLLYSRVHKLPCKGITLERERAGLDQNTPLYSSSLFIWRNNRIATPKTTKDDSSIVRAPHPMTPACFRMDGMAMLPTIDAPVKNFVKFTQLQWQ